VLYRPSELAPPSVPGAGGTSHGVQPIGSASLAARQQVWTLRCGQLPQISEWKAIGMIILAVLLIELILGGLGFVLHVLW
jgi:hypothetical protein